MTVSSPAGTGAVPLSHNRAYRVLWSSQALSLFGYNAATIAVPLLVLATTGSAAASGLVLGTIAAAQLLAALPAGALADRWDRRRLMLGCEAAQAAAALSLTAAVWLRHLTLVHLLAVAVVSGVSAALFEPAEDACLPTLVPEEQLPTAVALNSVRGFLGQVCGTAAGGFLFAVARALPFLADTLAHALAGLTLTRLRVPPRPPADSPTRPHLGREVREGLSFVWRHRDIRVTALCAVVLNLFFSAFYLVVIVHARRVGVPAGQLGLVAAALGVGGAAGALAAPWLGRRLRPYTTVLAAFWVLTALTPAAAVVHHAALFGLLFFGMALLPPAANTAIVTRQLLATPDGLRGRLTAVLGAGTGLAAAVGPPLGGLLTGLLPGGRAVLVCAAGIGAVTVVVTLSPTLRAMSTNSPTTNEKETVMDDDGTYEVLRNDEDQYSLWPLGHEVPAGWHRVGKEGTRDECSAYVDEVWTDMRPRSLRERMAQDERA